MNDIRVDIERTDKEFKLTDVNNDVLTITIFESVVWIDTEKHTLAFADNDQLRQFVQFILDNVSNE